MPKKQAWSDFLQANFGEVNFSLVERNELSTSENKKKLRELRSLSGVKSLFTQLNNSSEIPTLTPLIDPIQGLELAWLKTCKRMPGVPLLWENGGELEFSGENGFFQ